MGSLQLAITWYKNRHTGEKIAHGEVQNKENLNLVALFWMSQSIISSPVWLFLYSVIASCKWPIDFSGTPRPVSWHARKRVFFSFNDVTTLSLSSYLFKISIEERRRSQLQSTINSLRKNKTKQTIALHALQVWCSWSCTPCTCVLNGPARPARAF